LKTAVGGFLGYMEYAQFGKTGLAVSRFGLGCMRFPKEEKEAIEMVRYAIDNGINYLDTAYAYKDSEVITGRALRDGYRKKVYIATKCLIRKIEKYEDFEAVLDEELKRLGTDYIDVYLFHNMDHVNWNKIKNLNGLDFIDKMIKKGKIRYKAFSIHDTLPVFKEIIDSFDWAMTQIQLNILGEDQQVGVEGLRYAAEKGIATVIMEPLRGGYLLSNVPEEVNDLIRNYPEKRPLVEWCFRWLYNMPDISVILSGTSSLEQLKDNLRIFNHASPNSMSDADQEMVLKIRKAFEAQKSIGCTGCRYCMPCPRGVKIPDVFKLYNNYQFMNSNNDKYIYKRVMVPAGSGADQCVSCGICMKQCPQGLEIPGLLKKVHSDLINK
jgi:Predicted oxidoreductases of the aldo/keto reductase family